MIEDYKSENYQQLLELSKRPPVKTKLGRAFAFLVFLPILIFSSWLIGAITSILIFLETRDEKK